MTLVTGKNFGIGRLEAYPQKLAYAYHADRAHSSVVGAFQAKVQIDDPVVVEDGAAAPAQHLVVAAMAPSHQMGPSSCSNIKRS